MKKLLLILLCVPLIGFGQGWTYGGPELETNGSIEPTNDGGYIFCGTTESFGTGDSDIWVVKIDNQGNVEWQNTYGDTLNYQSWGSYISITNDGGYIISGGGAGGLNSGELIKLNHSGIVQWRKTYSQVLSPLTHIVNIHTVEQTTDGGYIMSGWGERKWVDSTWGFPQSGIDDIISFIIKTDSLGNIFWDKVFPLSKETSYHIEETTSGDYIMCGLRRDTSNGIEYPWVCHLDYFSNIIWEKTYDTTLIPEYITQTTDGGFIFSNTDWVWAAGFPILNLSKIDAQGNMLWSESYGSGGLSSVQQTLDGGYVVSCISGGYLRLIKTDNIGDTLFTKEHTNISAYGCDNCKSFIRNTSDGGYIVSLTSVDTTSNNFNINILVVKIDNSGNITSTFNTPMPSTNRKREKIIDILGRDINPERNKPFIEIYNDGTVEKKIIIE
jgi:hypothetical protein